MPKQTTPLPTSVINPVLPQFDPAISVFINCPYDEDYKELLNALIFTTVCCGLQPRMANESEATDVTRMERIAHAVFNSDYSIHDLSRCCGEGEDFLARFNMPLELGLAMGRRYAGSVLAQYLRKASMVHHRWLVLVPKHVRHERFISDLQGFDPIRYEGTVETIVPNVLRWLRTIPKATEVGPPKSILEALDQFQIAMKQLQTEWAGEVPWVDIVDTARDMVPRI